MTIVSPIVLPVARPISVPAVGGDDVASIAQLADALFDYRYSSAFQEASAATAATGTDPVGFVQDLANSGPATQDTSSWRPALSSRAWDFDGTDDFLQAMASTNLIATSTFTVPDLADSVAGKGFTNTGITLDTSDGTLWVANDGRSNGADVTHRPGVVNMTTAGALIVERDLSATFPSMTTIQGLVYDAVDDSLWLCSQGENKVRHISAVDGSDIGNFTIASCNGISINTTTNELIVTAGGNLYIFSKAGVQQATFAIASGDCTWYDNTTGIFYYTVEPASGVNYIGMFHLASRQYLDRFVLPEVTALEGLVISGTRMYVTSDAYFHGGTSTNKVVIYDLPAVPTYVTRTKITLAAKFTLDSAPAGTRSVFGASSLGVTNAGVGLHVIGSSSTGLRVFANTTSGTTERSFVDFTSLPDLTTTRYVLVEIDMTAKEVRLWVDGTQYGGTKSIPNVSGGVSTQCLMIGAQKFSAALLPGVGKVFALFNRNLTASEKTRLHAYLAAA